MRASIPSRGLLQIIGNCTVDLVVAVLAFARADETD